MKNLLLTSLTLLLPIAVFSQNETPFAGIRISGYLQTQFQKAESPGIRSWSGGDFDKNSGSRFMIRRGRVKIERDDEFSNITFQLDGNQDGVRLMDAYLQLRHPKMDAFSLTAGLFNRPFGYATSYSSSDRAFPERARVFQTVMPRERDLGAMLTYQPKKVLPFLTAELALVNGSGLNAKDYDSKKDLIGNLHLQFDSLASEKLKVGFGGSIYQGSVRSNTNTYLEAIGSDFQMVNNAQNKHLKRNYYGANLQVDYKNNFGNTSFKSEYIQGTQPGISASTTVSGLLASQSFNKQPTGDLYLRNFNGYFFWLTQEIGNSNLTAILGYDVYDPNTNVDEKEIGRLTSYTTAGDIKFSTMGYGITYALSNRLKLTIYNEHVKNDGTQFTDFQSDVKDNVFTTRLQYKW